MLDVLGYIAFGLYAAANLAVIGLWIYLSWFRAGSVAGEQPLLSAGDGSAASELATSGC